MQNGSPSSQNPSNPNSQNHQNSQANYVGAQQAVSDTDYEEMRKRAHQIAKGILHSSDQTATAQDNSVPETIHVETSVPQIQQTASNLSPVNTEEIAALPTNTELPTEEVEAEMKSLHNNVTAPSTEEEKQSFSIIDTVRSMIRQREEELEIVQADIKGLKLLEKEIENPKTESLIHIGRALAARDSQEQKAA